MIFYREWSSGSLPNMLVVLLQDPNPFYDDAYAVNSANLGPYGDAMIHELIPEVEETFRAIGEPWSRTTFGGSTGWLARARGASLQPGLFQWCLGVLSGPRGLSLLSTRRHLR